MTTVAIYSPGDMGSIVGRVLRAHGLRVIACLAGRSARTERLAEQAELELVPSYADLVQQADLILSILVPAQAEDAARQLVDIMSETGATPTYADCNAISPATSQRIATLMQGVGAAYVDASIIGPPPHEPGRTRFYAAGPHADQLAALNAHGLDVRVVSEVIGEASAVKMCYAALTKGTAALMAQVLIAAEALGVRHTLTEEFTISQAERLDRMERVTRYAPAKSRRFVGEMEEIAATFATTGTTPLIQQGAAEIYRLLGATALADRNPEDPAPPPSLDDTLDLIMTHITESKG